MQRRHQRQKPRTYGDCPHSLLRTRRPHFPHTAVVCQQVAWHVPASPAAAMPHTAAQTAPYCACCCSGCWCCCYASCASVKLLLLLLLCLFERHPCICVFVCVGHRPQVQPVTNKDGAQLRILTCTVQNQRGGGVTQCYSTPMSVVLGILPHRESHSMLSHASTAVGCNRAAPYALESSATTAHNATAFPC